MNTEIISLEEINNSEEMKKYNLEPEGLEMVQEVITGLHKRKAELEADLSIGMIVKCGWALTYQNPETTNFRDLKVYNRKQNAFVPIMLDIAGTCLFEKEFADANIKRGAAGGRIHCRAITEGQLAETIEGLKLYSLILREKLNLL